MANGVRSFLRDERAAFDGWTVVQILLILIIPAALVVFWYQYLRRIGADEAARDPLFAKGLQPGAVAVPTDQKRTCSRCGLTVRPPKMAGPPTCPNCMNLL